MNKAFVKEDAEDSETTEVKGFRPNRDELGSGKNYMTPRGAKMLQDEQKELHSHERPEVVRTVEWAAGNGDRSENGDYIYGKRRLREIDKRLAYLSRRLKALEVIDPVTIKSDCIQFGATVTYRDENDVEKTYAIVGVDEADIYRSRISWVSPLAKALMKRKEGDVIEFRSPKGMQEIEVVKVAYLPLD